MRKRSSYRPRPLTPPMLVNRGLIEADIENRERMLVEAFAGGWATPDHFDNIADMRNLLTIAATYKRDQSMLNLCDAMRIPMANLRERHARTGRLGLTGDELQLMRHFIDAYRDFWIRCSVSLYVASCDALSRSQKIDFNHGADHAKSQAA